jgi:hypothetical protein
MRLPSNDQKQIYTSYLNINEASVANMGTHVPGGNGQTPGKQGVKTEIGSTTPKVMRPSSAMLHPSFTPKSENNEEEQCGEEGVDMAKGQLLNIADKSIDVFQHLHKNGKLESWVAAKITLAADYISTVSEYLNYNKPNQMEVGDDVKVVEVETEDFPN